MASLVFSRQELSPKAESVLAAIPADSMLVVTADLPRARASTLLAPLLEGGRELPDIGKLADVCGFDPVTRLREIALAIPPGDEDDIGIVATGPIDGEALALCASKLIEKRGGEAAVESDGSFTTVRDARGMQSGHIAVRTGGPVLLGEGAHWHEMMRTAKGAAPSVLQSAHARLREELGESPITATMIIPEEMRERIKRELDGRDLPVMHVLAAGAVISLTPSIRIRALASCDTEEACESLAESLRDSRDESTKGFGARLVGAGKLLGRVHIEAKGKRLEANVEMTAEEASTLVNRLFVMRTLRRAMTASGDDDARLPALPTSPPDEVVKPRPN